MPLSLSSSLVWISSFVHLQSLANASVFKKSRKMEFVAYIICGWMVFLWLNCYWFWDFKLFRLFNSFLILLLLLYWLCQRLKYLRFWLLWMIFYRWLWILLLLLTETWLLINTFLLQFYFLIFNIGLNFSFIVNSILWKVFNSTDWSVMFFLYLMLFWGLYIWRHIPKILFKLIIKLEVLLNFFLWVLVKVFRDFLWLSTLQQPQSLTKLFPVDSPCKLFYLIIWYVFFVLLKVVSLGIKSKKAAIHWEILI